MAEAVRLAAPENFIRPFLDHWRRSVPLLTLVLHTSNLTAETQSFVKQVLQFPGSAAGAHIRLPKAELTALSAAGAHIRLPKAELTALSAAASITVREQQVLERVSAGLSNRAIAAEFALAESTVKTHLKSIYRKLDVNSRTQALAQAQSLKLV
jgi:ATP/maltotriose-dependent transcriptional regulator MalT